MSSPTGYGPYARPLNFVVTSTGADADGPVSQSFGAHFCEVEVDEAIGRASVMRWVAVMDCGRVLNPKLARNQVMGGITFGLGMALLEQVPYDEHTAQLIGEYYLPTHADRPDFDISFVDVPDYALDPIGVRGIGEIGTCGVPAAIEQCHLPCHRKTAAGLADHPGEPDGTVRPGRLPMSEHVITLHINGESRTVTADIRSTLLDLLRERLHLTGTKKGCDHGLCGACTVSVDGERVVSCLTLAASIDGCEVLTIEGIGTEAELDPCRRRSSSTTDSSAATARRGRSRRRMRCCGSTPVVTCRRRPSAAAARRCAVDPRR